MLWAALAFACGILAGWQWWRPPALWMAAVLAFAISAMLLRRAHPRVAVFLVAMAVAAAGALSYAGRSHAFDRQLQTRLAESFAQGDEVTVTGMVTADGVLRQVGSVSRQVVDLQVESVGKDGHEVSLYTGLRLSVYARDTGMREDDQDELNQGTRILRYGERVRFAARLRTPRNFGNPGAWDYRDYLAARGITLTAATGDNRITMLEPAPGSTLQRWRNVLRRKIVERIHAVWTPQQAALADAMLIGERSYVERPVRTDFQRAGTYHILVVSGMNVGILALVVLWIMRRLGTGEVVASLAAFVLAAGYAFVANAEIPVVRATLMLAAGLGARLLYRDQALLNTVGVASLVLLAADPRALFEASFQLTFLSVLAIVGIAVPWLERTSLPYHRALRYLDSTGYDLLQPPTMAQFRLDL
ncbi:MAG: ComEC/Rec2 family competence protein, partial [Candidatus Korobacteraceae bacterium]